VEEAPGFIDFLSISVARVRRIGIYHMVANLTAVGIFAVSFWLRWIGTLGFLPAGVSLAGSSSSVSPAGSAGSWSSCTAWV
jgi:hypothetical protein